ncbi:MAG: zinc-ribbon domain-containing protein [Agathobacter sp.]|nr:zinc-ribbon domain-containing protein [Agathobacter sp.]
MKCSNCGAEISDDSRFCTFCGAKTVPVEAKAEETPVETQSVQAAAPAQETQSVQAEAPVQGAAAQETQPVQAEAPAQETQPAQAETPVQETQPAQAEAPVQGAAVQETQPAQGAAAQETQPAQAETPAQGAAAQETQPQQVAQQAAQPQQTWQPVPQPAPAAQSTGTPEKKSVKAKPIIITVVVAAIAVLVIFIIVKLIGSISGGVNEKSIVYQKDDTLYYMSNMDKEDSEIEIADTREYFSDIKLLDDGKALVYIDERKSELYVVQLDKLKKDSSKNDKYIEEIDSKVSQVRAYASDNIYYLNNDGELYYYNGKESKELDDDVDSIEAKCGNMLYYQSYNKDGDYVLNSYNLKTEKGDKIAKNAYVYANDDGKIYILADDELQSVDGNGKAKTLAEDVESILDIDTDTGAAYIIKQETQEGKAYDYVTDDAEDYSDVKEPVKSDYFTETTPEIALDEYDYEEYVDDPDYFFDWLWTDEETGMYYLYSSNCESDVYTDKTNWYIFDSDKYWDDEYDYENVAYDKERIETLREDLKSEDVTITKNNLYYIDGDKETLIQENVSSSYTYADAEKKVVFFGVLGDDEDGVSIKISDIYSASDVQYQLDDAYSYSEPSDYYYAVGTSDKQKLKDIPTGLYSDSNSSKIVVAYVDDVYDTTGAELVAYTVSGKDLKEDETLSKDAYYYGKWYDDGFYFYDKADNDEGNLTKYDGGKPEEIAKDVSLYSLSINDDGSLIEIDDSYDLIYYDKSGKDKRIDRDVDEYSYINSKRIVYVSDGDLYVYTGKDDSQRISRNVYTYWVPEEQSGYSNNY